jgi:hypothetical protein
MINLFAPNGNELRDFCYINLFVYTDETKLMSGGTLRDKIQFAAIKRKIKQKINITINALFNKKHFDFKKLKGQIRKQSDNGWDDLLNNVVLRVIIKNSISQSSINKDTIYNEILSYFVSEVQNRYEESQEFLNLHNDKMEIESSMDLLVCEAHYKNKK